MKGIIFTEPMFHKVVNGEKTQTRRTIKPQPGKDLEIPEEGFINFDGEHCFGRQRVLRQTVECRYDDDGKPYPHCSKYVDVEVVDFPVKPRYKPGEKLYLKEPHKVKYAGVNTFEIELKYTQRTHLYFFDKFDSQIHSKNWVEKRLTEQKKSITGYCNKMFMPAFCAKNFIEITGMRCEKLQDISDEDCFREGIEDCDYGGMQCVVYGLSEGLFFQELGGTPIKAYAALIDGINGKGIWKSNPFVWVYDFKLTTK